MSRIAKTLACVLAATAVTAVAPRAHADENEVSLENLGHQATSAWSGDRPDGGSATTCWNVAENLTKAGTPDSAKVPIFGNSGRLRAGTSTLGEVKAECRRAMGEALVANFSGPLGGAAMLFELKSFDPSDPNKVTSLEPYVRACTVDVDAALKFGIDPAKVIDMSWGEARWSGPLSDVKAKVCAQGETALKAAVEAQLGPFKAVGIAGDKLDMIASYYPLGFYIPGGSYSVGATDPKALKKANVWFVISEGDYCGGDKIEYVFKRYQFDKNQMISKTSEKKYCGDPGAKAVR